MRLVGVAVALATAWTSAAQADLAADVRDLVRDRLAYGHVQRLKPRLLERGERLPLSLPPERLNPKDSSCATLSVLGVPTAHFVIRFSEFDPGALPSAFPEASAVGAIDVTRCGSSKPFLGSMVIEMRSPRGVLETVLSVAPAGVPPLAKLLKTRDPGVELPLGDPGAKPALSPLRVRLRQVAARAKRDGAVGFAIEDVSAGADGSAAISVSLSPGCHELTLLANDRSASDPSAVDLDLEAVDERNGARLAADRGEETDARVAFCIGEETPVTVRFVGAAPGAITALSHAHWELPRGLPEAWGPEARARLAQTARRAKFEPKASPFYQSLGVQGLTRLAIEVEPDACYTLLLAPLRGEVRGLSLFAAARVPNEVPRGAVDDDGAAVAFCAQGAEVASIQVEGEGSNLAWLLAVWETGRGELGAAIP